MPYVAREADGTLSSLHRRPQGVAREFLDDDDPEVQAFVGRGGDTAYERLDADFIRVLEDLIDVLLRRKLIAVTDLPADAQRKLFARKGHRAASPLSELNLLGEGGAIDGIDPSEFGRFG
jgi:hypothetical protein